MLRPDVQPIQPLSAGPAPAAACAAASAQAAAYSQPQRAQGGRVGSRSSKGPSGGDQEAEGDDQPEPGSRRGPLQVPMVDLLLENRHCWAVCPAEQKLQCRSLHQVIWRVDGLLVACNRDMYLGREFEEMCAQMYYRGKMFGALSHAAARFDACAGPAVAVLPGLHGP